MKITDEHRSTLSKWGIVKLERCVPEATATSAAQQITQFARKHKLYTEDTWQKSASRFSSTKPFRAELNALSRCSSFPNFISTDLIKLAEELIGEPATPMSPGQQILFTLPGAATWAIPHDVWHIDYPRDGEQQSPGLQMFTFLEDVSAKGGGTLVVGGSHHLFNTSGRLSSKELKKRLQNIPYFKSLFDPNRAPITDLAETSRREGGIDLRIMELTGRPGDVYFMDLRTLHTPAPNASNMARLMLTCRLPRSAIASAYMHA